MDRRCAEASGSAGATGKQTALYAFGSLSRCFSVLCGLSAWRRCTCYVWRCRASETKLETYCDVRPGSVLAL